MLDEIYRMLDPVAFAVGPFVVRWYGIAYVAGFVCAALVLWQVAKRWRVRVDADSLLTVVLCAIVGAKKLEKYGKAFLDEIAVYRSEVQ